MADPKTYAISTVTRGMCVEARPNAMQTGKYDTSGSNTQQRWTIEQSDDGKSVAFRNVSNGQYLNSTAPGDSAKASTGAQQWWTLEPGDSPGTWWMKSNTYGNYLCNYGGSQNPNNTVWMWSSSLTAWSYTMLWYITEAQVSASFSFSAGGDSSSTAEQSKALEEKEKALKDLEQGLEAKKKELDDRTATEEKQKTDLAAKEKALSERQQKLEEREQALASNGSSGSSGASSQVADLQQKLNDAQKQIEQQKAAEQKVKEREEYLDRRERELAAGGGAAQGSLHLASSALNVGLRPLSPFSLISLGSDWGRDKNGLKPAGVENDFKLLPRDKNGLKPLSEQKPVAGQKDFEFLPRLKGLTAAA